MKPTVNVFTPVSHMSALNGVQNGNVAVAITARLILAMWFCFIFSDLRINQKTSLFVVYFQTTGRSKQL